MQDQVGDSEAMTSKEGNLEADDGTSESKKRPLIKPTKYHYYPHNQHLYLLPECATQQVHFRNPKFRCFISMSSVEKKTWKSNIKFNNRHDDTIFPCLHAHSSFFFHAAI